MTVYQRLLNTVKVKGSGFLVLLDPDRLTVKGLGELAAKAERNGADGFLIGSSLLLSTGFESAVKEVKSKVKVPVIIFPGNAYQVCKYADAILFMSLISGRNPHLLIGEQVKAAPAVKEYNLEPIPTGYMIVDSGKITSVLFMSDTTPIPQDKPDIAKAHALAAQYLGMKLVFLEAGSGAKNPVPDELISEVKRFISIPLVLGGGIRSPEIAHKKARAGANFIVIGNAFEIAHNDSLFKEFARAIHWKK